MVWFFPDECYLLVLLSNLSICPYAYHVFKVVNYSPVLASFNIGGYGDLISGVRPEKRFGPTHPILYYYAS